jgi:hypothetical protein
MKQNTRDNVIVFLGALFTLGLAICADRIGLPHKWEAAIFATVVPFTVMVGMFSARWRHWSFWTALAMCLSIHIFLIWTVFRYFLSNIQSTGLALWFPIVFIEGLVLLVVIRKIDIGLSGDKKKYVLS